MQGVYNSIPETNKACFYTVSCYSCYLAAIYGTCSATWHALVLSEVCAQCQHGCIIIIIIIIIIIWLLVLMRIF